MSDSFIYSLAFHIYRKVIAENAFAEMDVNHDGKVTEDEFVEAVLKHEKFAKMLVLKVVQIFDPDMFVKPPNTH